MKKFFHLLPFTLPKAVGSQLLGFLVHSQVNAILILCDVSSEPVDNVEMAGVCRCVEKN